ncbi:helix-turn-helix transcriptional regulator [Ornithinimicrobium flavum]|uniref:helix-turn-helix transcriptional regulator n=1 Tax=Ornithinimicrobium flavum TaxID=1288636 RepID=UPI00106FDBE0|nr:helix-turn-helix domain-containing protein [Ornithinimicrobium flavum]
MLSTVRDLGAAVRRARRVAGLSQQALADRAGVSRQWLSRLESGKGPSAELGKALDVLAALGLAVDLVAAPRPEALDDDPFAGLFEDGS